MYQIAIRINENEKYLQEVQQMYTSAFKQDSMKYSLMNFSGGMDTNGALAL
jgi:hypothetical protein